MKATQEKWNDLPRPIARLGYLDPDDYTIPERQIDKAQTDPPSVARFLSLLLAGKPAPTASVHFLYGRTPDTRAELVNSLSEIGAESGYDMIWFMKGNFITVVHYQQVDENFPDRLIFNVHQSIDEWATFDRNRRSTYEYNSGTGLVSA